MRFFMLLFLVFCEALSAQNPPKRAILYQSRSIVLIENGYYIHPRNTLLGPKRHYQEMLRWLRTSASAAPHLERFDKINNRINKVGNVNLGFNALLLVSLIFVREDKFSPAVVNVAGKGVVIGLSGSLISLPFMAGEKRANYHLRRAIQAFNQDNL